MKNRFLSLVLALVMVLGMVPMPVHATGETATEDGGGETVYAASVTVGDVTTKYAEFSDALTAWLDADNSTLMLLTDVTWQETIKVCKQNMVLDLGGCSLTVPAIYAGALAGYPSSSGIASGSLSLQDSKTGGAVFGRIAVYDRFTMLSGTVNSGSSNSAVSVNSGGNASICGGTLQGRNGLFCSGGTATVSESPVICGVGYNTSNPGYAVFTSGGALTISGAPVLSGGSGAEICVEGDTPVTLNTQPAEGTWGIHKYDGGTVAVPGDGIVLDPAKFVSATPGYLLKRQDDGSLALVTCDHTGGTVSYTYMSSDSHSKTYSCCGLKDDYVDHDLTSGTCACGAKYFYVIWEDAYDLYYCGPDGLSADMEKVEDTELWRGVRDPDNTEAVRIYESYGSTVNVGPIPADKDCCRITYDNAIWEYVATWFNYPCSRHIYEGGTGVCTNCGYICQHDGEWDEAFCCSVCGYACTHYYGYDSVTGTCVTCGKPCEHETFRDGVCKACEYVCPHSLDANGCCTVCDMRQIYAVPQWWSDCSIGYGRWDYSNTVMELVPETEKVYTGMVAEGVDFYLYHGTEWGVDRTHNLQLPESGMNCYYVGGYESSIDYTDYYSGKWGTYPCSHTWVDGTCTSCLETCHHTYNHSADGSVCTNCGYVCKHEQFNSYWGECDTCGYSCTEHGGGHQMNAYGACKVCNLHEIYVDTTALNDGAGWSACYLIRDPNSFEAMTPVAGAPGIFRGTVLDNDSWHVSNTEGWYIDDSDNSNNISSVAEDVNCLRITTQTEIFGNHYRSASEWYILCHHETHTADGCNVCHMADESIHTYEYSVSEDGATVTLACTAASCGKIAETVTLQAPEYAVYGDGKNEKATVLVNGAALAAYPVSYYAWEAGDWKLLDAAPTEPGSYKAEIIHAGDPNVADDSKTLSVKYTVGHRELTAADVTLSSDSFVYDDKEKKPTVSVTADGKQLIEDTDYNIFYSDSISVGTATVTVTGKGNYMGQVQKTYVIEYLQGAPDAEVSGTVGLDGWYLSKVTLSAPAGYQISTNERGTFGSSISSDDEPDGRLYYYLKNQNGEIALKQFIVNIDRAAPTGSVAINGRTGNGSFTDSVTFELVCRNAVTVTVDAADTHSGIGEIAYYVSDAALSRSEVEAVAEWTEYNGSFTVAAEDGTQVVCYVRLTDKAGNVTYLSSEGVEFDKTAPVISGVTDGGICYTTQVVTVTDENPVTVTVNGTPVLENGEIPLPGDTEAEFVIVATDTAGNTTTCSITMKPIASISAPIDAVTESNVNSGNTDAIAEAEAAAAAVDTTNATDAEKAAIKAIADQCDALQEVIADTAAEYERITDAIAAYDPDEVTSADKAELDKLAEDLEALAESGNLTDSEKAALETPAQNLDAMIETVNEVTEKSDRIADAVGDYALEAVKSSDKDEIKQLVEDIDALLDTDNLTDEERTALEGEKTKCENLLTKIEGTDALVDKLTEDVGAYDEDTVKSTDKAALEQLVEDIEAVIEGNTNITEEEKAELEALADTVEDLLAKIEEVADAPVTEDTEKVKDTTSENVKIEDKNDLEKAKEDLEDALTENAGNYTDSEKKAIQEEIDRIDDALEAIENVEAVEDAISNLPATVVPDDEENVAKIEAAKKSYDALSTYEKSLVSKQTKETLDKLTAAAVAYDIIKGDGSEWKENSNKPLSFTANGAVSRFLGIEINGKTVDPKHYEVKAGSTIVTLKQDYLDTLEAGKYTITFLYTNGETEGTFVVEAVEEETVPPTTEETVPPTAEETVPPTTEETVPPTTEETKPSTGPATGDDANVMLWFSLMIVSCAAILVLLNDKKFFSYGGKYSK